jgi:hypothetical protein
MKFILPLLLTVVLVSASYVFPVSLPDSNKSAHKTDIAKVYAEKLQQKILLSEDQAVKVKSVLNDYLASAAGNKNASVTDKIANLLDQKQKAKFDIIKNEWWNAFTKEVKKLPAK